MKLNKILVALFSLLQDEIEGAERRHHCAHLVRVEVFVILKLKPETMQTHLFKSIYQVSHRVLLYVYLGNGCFQEPIKIAHL
jgi:hypothetical protein